MTKMSKAGLSRRSFNKGAAAAGLGVLAAPAYIKNALSSSGEVNILMWSDYLPPSFIEAFTAETGIAVNYTGIGSNEEIINKRPPTARALTSSRPPTTAICSGSRSTSCSRST